jgi:hypothetical protein
MVVMMLNFDERQESVLVVVIEKNNFERMKHADPITLNSRIVGGALEFPRYEVFGMTVAYEENMTKVYELIEAGDLSKLLIYLQRGYQFDPRQGDGIRDSSRI